MAGSTKDTSGITCIIFIKIWYLSGEVDIWGKLAKTIPRPWLVHEVTQLP